MTVQLLKAFIHRPFPLPWPFPSSVTSVVPQPWLRPRIFPWGGIIVFCRELPSTPAHAWSAWLTDFPPLRPQQQQQQSSQPQQHCSFNDPRVIDLLGEIIRHLFKIGGLTTRLCTKVQLTANDDSLTSTLKALNDDRSILVQVVRIYQALRQDPSY